MDEFEDIKQKIGVRIKNIRTKQGLTQELLAEKIGINPKYLSNIERGKENPTLNILIKLSNALNSQIDEIFDVSGQIDSSANKEIITSLLENANIEDLTTIRKILSVILH